MVGAQKVAERPEFAEIPAEMRASMDEEINWEAFEVLHAEAVARGDLPPSPRTFFNALPGRVLLLAFEVLLGFGIGIMAVAVTISAMKSFKTV